MASESTTPPRRRRTRQRQLVLSSVENRCDHPSAEDIFNEVRKSDSRVSLATVYRNLHLLVDSGEILSIHTDKGERFDRRTDDHAHIVCEQCGHMEDAPSPNLNSADTQAAADTGYVVSSHELVFVGICPKCQAAALEA
ncbi:MAG: Fur family transcriptional regulator [Eggerthellaceae bacterium]|jgi:Fur family ferric uptake transcriptional regulator